MKIFLTLLFLSSSVLAEWVPPKSDAVIVSSTSSSQATPEKRRDISIEDLIKGFPNKHLFYFEMTLQNGTYLRAFNKCLTSRPADPNWIRSYCKKNPGFVNAFECSGDDGIQY